MPKVSVCIPTFNQIEYLEKNINSLLRQNYSDFEIVITDDSPGDIVKNFIDQYKNSPINIRYYKNLKSLGSPENWNESMRKARGEYIKILHHDDYLYLDDSLSNYVQLLDENPDSDFAFSATRVVTQNGNDWNHVITKRQLQLIKDNPLQLFKENLIGSPSATIFRKSSGILFDKNLKWIVDVDFYLEQLKRNRKTVYSRDLLVATMLPVGRVSDECVNNKEVQIYEYLYLLNRVYKNRKAFRRKTLRKCILQVIYIFNTYKIKNSDDIHQCGYFGDIHFKIKIYLSILSVSSNLARLYVAILRLSIQYF